MTAYTSLDTKALEAALVAERNYTHALLQALPLGICTVDNHGRVVSLNPEGERILGWSEASCAGASLHEMIGCRLEYPESESMICPLKRVIGTGKPAWATHTTLLARDGSARPVEYKCIPLCSQRRLGAIFCFRDLSNQLQLEKDLQRLASMPEESPGPIVELDADANIIYANRMMMKLLDQFGFNLEGFPAILPADMTKIARRCLESGESVRGIEVTTGDKLYEWAFFAIPEVSLMRGYGIDLTERQRAEQELKRAHDTALETLRVKSEFLANVSHELRTPLNGIIGMTTLTLDTELSPEQQEYLGMVKSSAMTLLTLINGILDFSKIEAGKLDLTLTPFALRQSLGEMLKPLALRAHQKNLELVCEVHAEVPDDLVGDPSCLRQIIVNLTDNAIKFTHEGEVTIRIHVQEYGEDDICLHVRVTDTGIGIPEGKQKLIFDPFTQADGSTTRMYGGTGLGLAIVAQLVDMMAGRLWVESPGEGAGTTFHFTARFGTESRGTQPLTSLPPFLQELPVLVVNGNAISRRVLATMLQSFNLRPTAVESAQAAIEALEQSSRSMRPFGLILIDAHLSEDDGFGLAKQIQQHLLWSEIPIVMLTIAGHKGGAERPQDLGIAGFVNKPVLSTDLTKVITSALSPQALSNQNVVQAVAPSASFRDRKLHVLLAEDNVVNQKVAAGLLKKWGNTVVVVNNGHEVLTAFSQDVFDLVLMDVQMPEMDGLEATVAIRAQEKSSGTHVPIIALTAHAMQGDRERCMAAGMDGYLSKPLQPSELLDIVCSVVAPAESEVKNECDIAVHEQDIFDPAALLARVDGDAELMQEIVVLFLEDYPRRMACIKEALDANEGELLVRASHSLKGAVSNLCATRAFKAVRDLEASARQGDMKLATEVYAVLKQDMKRLHEALVLVSMTQA